MKAVAVIGYKKSGKTTLALALIEELKKLGLSVAAAKHSSHGFADREGSDTARFRAIGCPTLAWSDTESMVTWPRERGLLDLLSLVRADVLVCEGAKTEGFMPRIILADDAATARELGPELALAIHGKARLPGLPTVNDPAALARLVVERGFVLPGLDCESCGRADCRALAAEIVAGAATPADCAAHPGGSVRVTLAGQDLPLNPFVARIVAGGIRGLLAELKGYTPGPVTITLD